MRTPFAPVLLFLLALALDALAVTPPGPPRNLRGTGSDQCVFLFWDPPTSTGGAPILSTQVYRVGQEAMACQGGYGGNNCTVCGLVNGTFYTFLAKAVNEAGVGPASDTSAPVAPKGIPAPPTGVEARAGDKRATVSWHASPSTPDEPILGYDVTAISDPLKTCGTTGALTCDVTNLTNGTSYAFTVRARNRYGSSQTSVASAPVIPMPPDMPPGAPTSVTGVVGDKQVTLSWMAPADVGSSPIKSYWAYSLWDSTQGCPSSGMTCTVTGLANGTGYYFLVKATNDAGTGPASAHSPRYVPKGAPPGPPTGVSAVPGDGQATISWQAPSSEGSDPIAQYLIRAEEDTTKVSWPEASDRVSTISGLANGTAYTFTVRAFSLSGLGPRSAPSAPVTPQPPATVPGAPTKVEAVAGNAEATVSWTAPASDGGSPITKYTAVVSDIQKKAGARAQSCETKGDTTCTIKGLTNGQSYAFTVTATNRIGTGPASALSAPVTPATVPGAPTSVKGKGGNGQVTVSWKAPAATGGAAITRYTAYAVSDPGKICTTTVALTCDVTGLTNGTAYTFQVTASNRVGAGPASAASAKVTPAPTVPGAPTNVNGNFGLDAKTMVEVAWTAPASDGGSAITKYKAYVATDAAKSCTTSAARHCTVKGLKEGTAYTFKVSAGNKVGAGPASAASAPVTVKPLPRWTKIASVGPDLKGVAGGSGPYVAVGMHGAIVGSADGKKWNPLQSGTTKDLAAVATRGSQWVAVGAGGTILTSGDGVTWKPGTSGTKSALNAVTWAGTQWVAVGAGGTILTSPDGEGWTPQTSGTTQTLKGVAWSGAGLNLLIAVGEAGTVAASPDGASWTPRMPGTDKALNAVTWADGSFVAVGAGKEPLVLTSSDGSSWTARDNEGSPTSAFYAVTWTGNMMLIAGDTQGFVLGAANPTWWAGSLGGFVAGKLYGITGDANKWVVVGADGIIELGEP